MSKLIYEIPIKLTQEQVVEIPTGALLLSVQREPSRICIFALADDEAKKEKRIVKIFSTGSTVSDEGSFLGTFQHGEVCHVFVK